MFPRVATLSWSVALALAGLSLVTACSVMWLAVSQPAELARSLGDGQIAPLVQALVTAVGEALRSLASWL